MITPRPDTTRCDVCAAATRDHAHLCDRCVRELRRALADLPGQLADLQVTVTRQARTSSGDGRGRRVDAALPYHPGAAAVSDAARTALTTWYRHLTDCDRGATAQLGTSNAALCAHLTAAVGQIRLDEAAGEIHADLTELAALIDTVIDTPEQRWYAGPCFYTSPDGTQCPLDLYAAPAATRISCDGWHQPGPGCGAVHNTTARRVWLLLWVQEALVPLDDMIAALPALTGHTSPLPDTVRHWLRRGALIRAGQDRHGVDLYRGGDLLALARRHQ